MASILSMKNDEGRTAKTGKASNKSWSGRVLQDKIEPLLDSACDAIPSDDINAMPKHIRYTIGIFFYLSLAGIFIGLFLKAYNKSVKLMYLSPKDSTTGSVDDYCDIIETTNTGTFLGTTSGVWEGMPTFDYSEAIYKYDVTSFSANITTYRNGMDYIYQVLQNLSIYMNVSDLSTNILVWTSFSIAVGGSQNLADSFSFTGSPESIFNRQVVTGAYASVHGVCQNISSQSTFDVASSSFMLTYGYQPFIMNPICKKALIPQLFGYLPGKNSDSFRLQIDVRSLVTALSINLGIATFYQMNMVATTATTLTYDNIDYQAAQFYDTKYTGMEPVYCIIQSGTNYTQCSLFIAGNVYAIPFLNHAGQSMQYPVSCNCSTLTTKELVDQYNPCNLFRFLGGLIYWNTFNYTSVFELIAKYNGNMHILNKLAYNASFIASYFGQTSPFAAELQSNQSLYDAFEFCNIPSYGYCSMVTFTAFDYSSYTWTVSEYYHQLTTGACRNSLLSTKNNWDKLSATPFTPLQESYQKCHASPTTAATTNIGVTMGNITAIAPIFAVVLMLLVVGMQYLFGIRIKKSSHTKKERQRAIDEFAELLLDTRDRYSLVIALTTNFDVLPTGKIQNDDFVEDTVGNAVSQFERYRIKSNLKMAFVHSLLDVSKSKVTFDLLQELDSASNHQESSHHMGKSALESDDGIFPSNNPLHREIGIEMRTDIIMDNRNTELQSSKNGLPLQLVLVINKPKESPIIDSKLISQPSWFYTAPPNDKKILLDSQIQSYDQWLACLSALNIQFNLLLTKKQQAEVNGAIQESFERDHLMLTQELQYFSTLPWQTMRSIFFHGQDHEYLLYYSLLSILEAQGCLLLQIYNRSLIQKSYQHKIGIAFADIVFSYADLTNLLDLELRKV